MNEKRCTACGETKALAEFETPLSRGHRRPRSWCRDCTRAYYRRVDNVECPHCEGDGSFPGAEVVVCHLCQGDGQVTPKQAEKYEREFATQGTR